MSMLAKLSKKIPVRRFLVNDEDIIVESEGVRHYYRMRIWRGMRSPSTEALPVVLVSQVNGGPPPCWHQTALANMVSLRFLKKQGADMLYFESAFVKLPLFSSVDARGGHVLNQIYFETKRTATSCIISNPVDQIKEWKQLDALVGGRDSDGNVTPIEP